MPGFNYVKYIRVFYYAGIRQYVKYFLYDKTDVIASVILVRLASLERCFWA